MRSLVAFLSLAVGVTVWAQGFVRHGELFNTGPNPSAIAAADLNGDEIPDIVTADTGRLRSPRDERPANNEISLLLSEDALDYALRQPLRAGFGPYDIKIANIDARKALDIVVASFIDTRQREGQRDLTLFCNLDDNIFEPFAFEVADENLVYKRAMDADNQPAFATPGLTALFIRDINGDGLRDAVATGWASDTLAFFPGHAETHFGEAQLVEVPGGPRDLVVDDFDGDGKLDVAVACYISSEVALLKGNGDGQFEAAARFVSRGLLPTQIRAADLNGDGDLDLAVSHCDNDDSIVLFFGEGNFRFSLSQEILLGPDRKTLEHGIRGLVVDDLNGDGRPDLAAACYASAKVVVLTNAGNKDGMSVSFDREDYSVPKGMPRAICAADFNQDGKKDLGVALWDANAVTLLLGR